MSETEERLVDIGLSAGAPRADDAKHRAPPWRIRQGPRVSRYPSVGTRDGKGTMMRQKIPRRDGGRAAGSLSYKSPSSVLSAFGVGNLLSFASVLSIGSVGSILSIGSAGSILSIGSTGSVLSIGSVGSILSIGGAGEILNGRREEDEAEDR